MKEKLHCGTWDGILYHVEGRKDKIMMEYCGSEIKYFIKSERQYPRECAKERQQMGRECVKWIENIWK